MRIKVTQEDIDLSLPDDEMFNPAAMAIGVLIGDSLDAKVYEDKIIIIDRYWEDYLEISIPELAKLNTERFNRGEVIEPYEFELEIPSWFLYEGSEEGGYDSSSSDNTSRHSQGLEEGSKEDISVQSTDCLTKEDV